MVDEIDIIYAADENYNKQLAISINSLLSNFTVTFSETLAISGNMELYII